MHIIFLSLINLKNCRRQFSLIHESAGEMKIHSYSWKLIPSLIASRPHQTDFVAVFTAPQKLWLNAITKAVAAVKRPHFLFKHDTKTFIAIEFISSRPSFSRNWNGILLCSSPCSWLADKHTLGSWLHYFRYCAGIHYQLVINLHFFQFEFVTTMGF